MNYDREDYMRRQEAEHAMIRMRDPRYDVRNRLRPDPYGCPYLGTPKPCPLCDCARRDSDGSPKGGDCEAGSVHDGADPKGIAHTTPLPSAPAGDQS